METAFFLRDLVVLFGIAVLVSYVFRVVKLSSIAGFLVAGALVGPFGLRLISNLEDVQRMSEIGVMLLLFSIGVEFSAEKLLRMKWVAVVGGGLQLGLTTMLTALIVYGFVHSTKMAILAGMLAALSSTVIGLRLLYDRGQTHSPQGSVALAILIFQDLAVVPAMMFLPLLTGGRSFDLRTLITTTVVSLIAVVSILAAAWFVAPRIIAATIRARSRDVFILSVITVVLGTAYLTSRAGLSTALGAFVAGIVISESEYSHQVLADVLPFRETFNSLFFVSIGMLLDPGFLLGHLGIVSIAALAVVAGKTAITAGVVALLGMPWRIALAVGLFLGEVGEFSLVLLNVSRSSAEFPEALARWRSPSFS
jgi:CPA2 family monovalent cation:H+ antiporter-2